jgi:polyhydroxybutyrate depolymerase
VHRAIAGTAAAALLLAGLSGCARWRAHRNPPPASSAAAAATRTVGVPTKDGTRQAIVVHPPSATGKPALVVMLHGGFGNGAQAERDYGWDAEASREGFVVAYPDGIRASWNVGRCCGPAMTRGIDDVGFLHALVTQLEKADGVDPNRVYAVGMSNGAMMTYTWACDDPGELAGIGPVAGSLLTDCPKPHPLTVVAIHGTDDQNVPINGGVGPKGTTGVDNPSLAQTLAPFLAADGCPRNPQVSRAPPLTTSVWSCAGGRSVTTRIVDGAGHQWPGSRAPSAVGRTVLGLDPPSTAFDATDFLWQHLRSATRS